MLNEPADILDFELVVIDGLHQNERCGRFEIDRGPIAGLVDEIEIGVADILQPDDVGTQRIESHADLRTLHFDDGRPVEHIRDRGFEPGQFRVSYFVPPQSPCGE